MTKMVSIFENDTFKVVWRLLEIVVLGIAVWLIGTVNQMQSDIAILKAYHSQQIKIETRIESIDKQLRQQNDLLIELRTKFEMAR